ncbi:MAG: hypothetical protein NTY39_02200 [Campylobacterales bacterium]|nr:hypothetical protein [Campylobacterales bacterium]
MKYTAENRLSLAMIITLVLITIAGIFALSSSSSLEESQNDITTLTVQAKEIESLKTRWSTTTSQNELTYLKTLPSMSKEERRGGALYLEFTNLSSNEFNHIANKLLNSMLVIKKLTLQRNSSSKGVIIVEVEA